VVAISSALGSIAQTSGGHYAYRMSKAALNMAMSTLAGDLQPRGVSVLVLCPGWVQTEMGGPRAPLPASASVNGLRRLIDQPSTPGAARFQLFDGSALPW
jgi:NAD(P)-dependent dehydrogenase (short-subunit alcohol dehydrogenase family)